MSEGKVTAFPCRARLADSGMLLTGSRRWRNSGTRSTPVRRPMRNPVLSTVLLAITTVGLQAQTTPTEREAAANVLRQIDSLQSRINPTAQARRLIAANGTERDRILSRVEQLWTTQFRSLSDHIGRNPEVGFKEYKSVDTLTRVLRAAGFTVTTGQAGLGAGFVGSWGSATG